MAEPERPPCILVVEADPGVATSLIWELQYGFGREYQFLATLSARSGLDILERLDTAGQPVALVIAGLQMPDMAAPDFFGRARSLHPLAKLASLAGLPEIASSEVLHRAMTLGQADCWLMTPWAPHDQSLHAQVADLLDEWLEDSGRRQIVVATIVGQRREAHSLELRDQFERSSIWYRFTAADSAEGRELLRRAGCGMDRLPVVILWDGQVLVQPTWRDLLPAFGARLQPDPRPYDVAVVGGGLAGLSAAIYAASEGLRTVLIEREVLGGQAGTSSRIRNYPGFPRGISGRRLARSAIQQALLFGVEPVVGEAAGLRLDGADRVVLLQDGSAAVARAVVVATGISYRRLGVRAADALVGAGVFYGSAMSEAPGLHGEDAVVVGAGNSAGQAAAHLARFARRVTLAVRGKSLEDSMSAYLVGELRSLENLTVRLRTQVVDAAGAGRLERVTLQDGSGDRHTIPAAALFILIGGEPRTEWLAGVLKRCAGGYIRTEANLAGQGTADAGPSAAQAPLSFEASVPGVFAVGDVRAGSIKRIATAVGDGSIVIRQVHDYLGRQ